MMKVWVRRIKQRTQKKAWNGLEYGERKCLIEIGKDNEEEMEEEKDLE